MSKQVWICEKCQSIWQDEASAKACEGRHMTPVSVKALGYPTRDQNRDQRFPLRVQVKIVPNNPTDWDYATYVLERIGPKGL